MILLWGMPRDTPLAKVSEVLTSRGMPAFFVDQESILETSYEPAADPVAGGVLRVGDRAVDLGQVTAAYVRPYALEQLPALRDLGPQSPGWDAARAVVDALYAWVEMTPALVVNRFSAMASNGSKPYQSLLIRAHGFHTPETLVTTDPEAVLEFSGRHGAVIYKSVSGVRSIVSRLSDAHCDRLGMVRWCPTQFQEYVPGIDYRVHVVGDATFGCEIISGCDDYRYAGRSGASTSLRACPVDDELAGRCVVLARGLGLPVAGVDLRRHPDGRWYCFEVNPSPAFSYYQSATGLLIGEAIADLLERGGRSK